MSRYSVTMRPPCDSTRAAATLRCHATLSSGAWRSSVLTRAYSAARKVWVRRSVIGPIILARRPGSLLDDPSENPSRGGIEMRKVGWDSDMQQLGLGFGGWSVTHRRCVRAEGRGPNHELILRLSTTATTPGIGLDDSRLQNLLREVVA